MNTPLLSVLMPVYNAEKYLAEAINSILQQTLHDFELLIIDDASVDSSLQIINSYNDPRIRLIRNEHNLGISATLNKGIVMCSTELIARMDADDISYPTRLQKQYEFFLNNPDCTLLATWAREITFDRQSFATEVMNSDYHYYALTFQCCIYHPTVMYNRNAVMSVGMYNTPYSEDFELWWQLTRRFKVASLHEVLLDYRLSEKSLCRVTKKAEYETVQFTQVVRNIHYYTGYNYKLNYNEVECFRYNCEPLLKEDSVSAIVTCLDKLTYITNQILAKENINLVKQDILQAAAIKIESIFYYFSIHFPFKKFAFLLLRTGNLKRLASYTTKYLLKGGKI
jgi:glycosyltransferase involved in cell wall biosynthesis